MIQSAYDTSYKAHKYLIIDNEKPIIYTNIKTDYSSKKE